MTFKTVSCSAWQHRCKTTTTTITTAKTRARKCPAFWLDLGSKQTDKLIVMTHLPVFCRQLPVPFLLPETGASRLVPETMTHFAGKWYRQKTKQTWIPILRKTMFYPAPATGASKSLVPEKYDTLYSCWRQSTTTGNWCQKTGECVITMSYW